MELTREPFLARAARLWLLLLSSLAAKKDGAAEREARNALAERLMSDYGNSVLRLAYSYVHNMSDAEEILQDTLLRYLEAAPAVESREHEKAWLLHAAANLAKNRIDYNRLRDTDELDEELSGEEREDLSFM